MYIRFAAGPTISATKLATQRRAYVCSRGGATNSTACMRAKLSIPCLLRSGYGPEIDLPIEPFADLIHAFVHDQTVTRYRDWDDVLITASIRQILSDVWCCIFADIATRAAALLGRHLHWRCNWRTSGRMSLSI